MNDVCINEEIEKFIIKYKKFMTKDIYITNKMYYTFLKKYKYLYTYIHHNDTNFNFLRNIVINQKQLIKRHNSNYVNRKLVEYKEYFDNMFKNIDENILLDDNQRKAIICEEDNLLLIAGAGSGKTTTMTAKVKYLIDKCNYKEKDIAIISFTNKACDEIKDKLQNGFGLENIDVYTFHKLGLTLLRASTNKKLDIIETSGQYKIFINYIKNILFKDKEKFNDFYNAFNYILNLSDNFKNFNNFKEYHDYLYKRKYTKNNTDLKIYIEAQVNKRKNYYKTIKGEIVKSKEEVDIANFLYLNSIDYEYEKSINKNIKNNKTYKPDFYIYENELFNYIEHFGVDELGNNSSFTEKELKHYLSTLKLKKEYHKKYFDKDLFIISYSNKDRKKIINTLREEIKRRGYTFRKRYLNEVYETLKNTSEDIYFYDFINHLLIPFISYFKGSNKDKNDFKELYKQTHDDKLLLKLKVIEDFYDYYETKLKENNLIDFEDMINLAYKNINNIKEKDLGVNYKYIIIDEYQDISVQRYNLTAKIANLFKSKIFAVGDDYQTIFSFAGSRIDLFTDFKKYMKDASVIPIENTYRNSQELLDLAADFINKNKSQIEKRLKSSKHLDKPVEIFTYEDSNVYSRDTNKSKVINDIIININKNNYKDKILLLCRYKKDIDSITNNNYFIKKNKEKIICNNCKDANITYLTIHSSKGLGFDQCILINAIDDKYGFPSKIEDDPLIKLIKPNNEENILFPEERRLFYVALTRTKNKLYIVCPKSKVSTFVKEIAYNKNVLIHKNSE